jgi:hypothetical protein
VRIRQVKPEFWKDPDVLVLPPFARLTYIGLWMLADDAGYFRLDIPTIALELYGWEPRVRREKAVTGAIAELVAARRVETFGCGHAIIPRLVDHQRFAGETKRVYTVKTAHARCLSRVPATPRGDPPTPDPFEDRNGDGGGSSRQGLSDARKRKDDDGPSEFQLRVPRSLIS